MVVPADPPSESGSPPNFPLEPSMPSLSIRLRLVLTLLLIIGAGGAVQVGGYLMERSDVAALQARSAALLTVQELVHELEESITDQHNGVTGYLLSGHPDALAAYQAARTKEAELFGSSSAILVSFPEVAGELQAVGAATDAWRAKFLDPTVALVQAGRAQEARSVANLDAGDAAFAVVSAADRVFDEHVASMSAATVSDIERIESNRAAAFLLSILGTLFGVLAAIWLLSRWIVRPLSGLLATARRVEAGEDVAFPAGRHDEIGRLGRALERMRAGLFGQATEASVVNRFTELTAFVEVDGDVARATLDALEELTEPDDGAIHISNRSKDRAVPEGSIGDVDPQVISLGQLSNCPGVRRSSQYVTSDLAARLSVRCPIYPTMSGTLACIPLLALGEVVGAVHLHWQATDALPLDVRGAVARITEHASLAIANRRLLTALQGMASTDGRTGLANSRSFDETLQERLASRDGGDPLSVLMLDIDHFKDFNDRNGPSGRRPCPADVRPRAPGRHPRRRPRCPLRWRGVRGHAPGRQRHGGRGRGRADPVVGRGDDDRPLARSSRPGDRIDRSRRLAVGRERAGQAARGRRCGPLPGQGLRSEPGRRRPGGLHRPGPIERLERSRAGRRAGGRPSARAPGPGPPTGGPAPDGVTACRGPSPQPTAYVAGTQSGQQRGQDSQRASDADRHLGLVGRPPRADDLSSPGPPRSGGAPPPPAGP